MLDVLSYIEAAVFILSSVIAPIYVAVRVVIGIRHANTAGRRLGLTAVLGGFLTVWGLLVFAGFVVMLMASVSDVQASPSHPEQWRLLSVAGGAAVVVTVLGIGSAFVAKYALNGSAQRATSVQESSEGLVLPATHN